MKKVLLCAGSVCVLSLLALPVCAERLHVQAMSDFFTATPSEFITFQAIDSIELSPGENIWSGDVVKAKIQEVKSPKRLKRNATFSIIPVSVTNIQGQSYNIKTEVVGKFSPKFEIDAAQLAKKTALGVGNYFVQGLSMGYHAVEGVVKNTEGNRLKSGAVSVYKNSPLSFIENGQDIEIHQGDLFSFKFKKSGDPCDEEVEECSDDD